MTRASRTSGVHTAPGAARLVDAAPATRPGPFCHASCLACTQSTWLRSATWFSTKFWGLGNGQQQQDEGGGQVNANALDQRHATTTQPRTTKRVHSLRWSARLSGDDWAPSPFDSSAPASPLVAAAPLASLSPDGNATPSAVQYTRMTRASRPSRSMHSSASAKASQNDFLAPDLASAALNTARASAADPCCCATCRRSSLSVAGVPPKHQHGQGNDSQVHAIDPAVRPGTCTTRQMWTPAPSGTLRPRPQCFRGAARSCRGS